jgi:hypothetical protein
MISVCFDGIQDIVDVSHLPLFAFMVAIKAKKSSLFHVSEKKLKKKQKKVEKSPEIRIN